jgi:diguanylate cyclase (GGDEF)-like protein/PAS domain S-box-containing protein
MLFAFNKGTGATASLHADFEQAVDAVVAFDNNRIVTHLNAAAERLWGYTRRDVLGRDVGMLLPIVSGGHNPISIGGCDLAMTRKDGNAIRGSLSLSQIDIDGTRANLAFVRDITDEAMQREKLAMLGLVVDSTDRAIYATCAERRICYVNAAFTHLFGYTPEDALGRLPGDLLIGSVHVNAIDQLHGVVQAEGRAEQTILLHDRHGKDIWVSAAINAIDGDDGQPRHFIAVMTDITLSRQLQSLQHHILEALANDQPLRDVVDDLCCRVEQIAPDVVCSLVHIDNDGVLHWLGGPSLSEDCADMVEGVAVGPDAGWCGAAAFHGAPVMVTDIDSDPRWQSCKEAPLSAGLKACWSTPIKARDGRVIGTLAFYYRQCRSPSRWHQTIVDACVPLAALVIEREETRREMSRLAYFDALTGLPNRAHMRQLMEQAVATRSTQGDVALMFLDIDHFKDVNDSHGPAIGDQLLIAVTERLRQSIRPADILSRQGGDEFVVLMPGCSAEDAARIAGRLTKTLSAPLRLGGIDVMISVSVGIAMFPDNTVDVDSLLKYAGAAMSKAKAEGRSTYRFFSADIDRIKEERLGFTAALRNAVTRNALDLHYQPQIRAGDGSLYGVEALARWNDAVLGPVSPAKFIPLAEECGLIEQIAAWSLREACRQIAAWHKSGLDVPCVSVNLSPINFENAELPALISSILAEYGLSPAMLMLEITEGAVMSERAIAKENMEKIRAWGVGLSMDDFGTGYSSLSRLAHLPVRELKIDRSFMSDIESKTHALAIATALIRVGQSLKMTVVAEGVETEGQRRVLADLGCDVTQGFLYSPALAAPDFEIWLTQRQTEKWIALVADCGAANLGNESHAPAATNASKLVG